MICRRNLTVMTTLWPTHVPYMVSKVRLTNQVLIRRFKFWYDSESLAKACFLLRLSCVFICVNYHEPCYFTSHTVGRRLCRVAWVSSVLLSGWRNWPLLPNVCFSWFWSKEGVNSAFWCVIMYFLFTFIFFVSQFEQWILCVWIFHSRRLLSVLENERAMNTAWLYFFSLFICLSNNKRGKQCLLTVLFLTFIVVVFRVCRHLHGYSFL